jgi:hypothetical protein
MTISLKTKAIIMPKAWIKKTFQNVLLYVFLFLLAAIVCFLLTMVVSEERKEVIDLLMLLSGSFLTTSIFSILLGFTQFTDYVTKRLRDVVVEKRYIRGLPPALKQELREIIDIDIFGEAAIREKGSLYEFVNNRMNFLYNSHYRTDFRDMYHMHKTETPGYWKSVNRTTYQMCFNKDSVEKLIVPYGYDDLCVEDDDTSYKTLLELEIVIHDDDLMLKKKDKGIMSLIPNESNKIFTNEIPIETSIFKEGDSKRHGFNVSITIPDKLTEEKSNFIVAIRRVQLINEQEGSVTSRVGLPTKEVYIACQISDGQYIMNCSSFGILQKRHVIDRGLNFASADLKEWILPGHGAVMIWRKIECNQ